MAILYIWSADLPHTFLRLREMSVYSALNAHYEPTLNISGVSKDFHTRLQPALSTQVEVAIRVLTHLALVFCAVRRQPSPPNSHRAAAEKFPVSDSGRTGAGLHDAHYHVGPSSNRS